MSDQQSVGGFTSPNQVIGFFHDEITRNGNPALAGLEEEIIVLDRAGAPVSHARFQDFLGDLLCALPGGEVIAGTSTRGGKIAVLCGRYDGGLVQPETNTTLVELAHAPSTNAWRSFETSRGFTGQLVRTAQNHEMVVLGGGAVPSMAWEDFRENDIVIPNADFVYSWSHMQNGTRPEYCKTVFGTASVHHNMGFNDPERMARYITTTLRLQPTMIALLGNAPLWDAQPALLRGEPLLSYRSRVQIDYGKLFGCENGVSYLYPDFLIDTDASFSSIVNGYLNLPLDRTLIGGQKRFCNGLTMRQYLDGTVVDGRRYWPEEKALTMMIREPIVDVRPNFTGSAPRVETRAHDNVSQRVAVSLDAFYRGIAANLEDAHALVSIQSPQEVRRARAAVCHQGLAAPLSETRELGIHRDRALALLGIAARGLLSRKLDEGDLLSPLWALAESGRNPAQRLLSVYEDGGKNMPRVLDAMAYNRSAFADGQGYAWPQNAPLRPLPQVTTTTTKERARQCCL